MDKVEDKMVEIARFQYVEQAQGLASLLQANGVVCYVRNEYTTQVMGLTDVGGIRVELLESDVEQAMQIMEANGYEIPSEDEEPEQIQVVAGWARHIPFLRNYTLEKQIVILFVSIAVFLVLLIFFGSQISSN